MSAKINKVGMVGQIIKEFSIEELLEFNHLISEVIQLKSCQEHIRIATANERPQDDIDRQLPI